MALPGLPASNRPVVFVADGAGDFRACSGSFRQTASADGLSLEVVTFVWSHGYLRNMADQTDVPHIRDRAANLADLILAHREKHPDAPITLVAHSAGSAVVLGAAERLPANSIERIVLLSPSLSENYDVRPALAACRDGIDCFVSEKDWLWLGVLVRILGTPDDPFASRAAGRYGFVTARDEAASKVRMHRWSPDEEKIGNDGGHFGCYSPDFLRRKIFPMLSPPKESPASVQ
ncbi:MAG: alpha/beta hydrolase [Gemmataceae bacterium]|nr:alpha/beta hydrolase [Gemmataceae bacterium]